LRRTRSTSSLFQDGRSDVSEEQRVSGTAIDAHDDEIVSPVASLSEDCLFGRDVGADDRRHGRVISIGEVKPDLLESPPRERVSHCVPV